MSGTVFEILLFHERKKYMVVWENNNKFCFETDGYMEVV